MTKQKIDPETKIELLIKLAFGIPLEQLSREYNLNTEKIINLRKNNYLKYNEFFDHWRIDKEVAVLGLSPKHERALSIVKKFYKKKIEITEEGSILYLGKRCNITEIMKMADEILKKDDINNWLDNKFYVKNHF